ncbi:MAG: hypothetical protein B9S34_03035 [Opitutia bacterium Tous-C1TDCM]|nr:MAG: hypothetical protein B9S34_03035 [Opitutae bacterium Tous-C1TDCM]
MRPMLLRLLLGLLVFSAAVRAAESDPPARPPAPHPRLLLDDAALRAAVAAAESDPLRAALHRRIVAAATAELGTKPVARVLVGPRLLDKSRTALGRILVSSLAYRLTGDKRFAARALLEMRAVSAFADWNPSHFLDVAELSLALALGYDWLHAALTPDERAEIRSSLQRHALVFARDAYAPEGPKDKRLWFVKAHHNWNQVCNGGLLAAALALAEDEPDLARTVVAGVRRSLPLAMTAYAPDGAYPEGPGYWGYGTSYNVVALALLESAYGTDFGLSAAPGFDRTADYRLHIQGTSGLAFNHADGGARIGAQAEYTWLARRFGLPTALAHSRALLETALAGERSGRVGDRLFALHAVWFPAAPAAAAPAPLDRRFNGPAELVTLRGAWGDPRAVFVGLKGGSNAVNHSHLDAGSFVLDAGGVRWAEDLGPDNYNLSAYFGAKRWTYYRLNNFSHNTLTPGDTLQDPKASAPVVAFASQPGRAFGVVDLTPVYPGQADKLLRGVALLDRRRVLVQDEAAGLKPGTPLVWRLHTAAAIDLADPRHAVLTLNGRTLRAKILAPADAVFTAAAATPPTAAENRNAGISVLSARFTPAGGQARLAVLLTPQDEGAAAADPVPVALADWK